MVAPISRSIQGLKPTVYLDVFGITATVSRNINKCPFRPETNPVFSSFFLRGAWNYGLKACLN